MFVFAQLSYCQYDHEYGHQWAHDPVMVVLMVVLVMVVFESYSNTTIEYDHQICVRYNHQNDHHGRIDDGRVDGRIEQSVITVIMRHTFT